MPSGASPATVDGMTPTDTVDLVLPAIDEPGLELRTDAGVVRVPGRRIPGRTVAIAPSLIRDLTRSAREAAARAYAPYSAFAVGAAAVMADDPEGRVFTGVNVENASYGGTLCAERSAIQAAVTAGFRRLSLLAVSAAGALEGPVEGRSPCGLCRQVIREFSGPDSLVILDTGQAGALGDLLDIDRLLPWGFSLEPARPVPGRP